MLLSFLVRVWQPVKDVKGVRYESPISKIRFAVSVAKEARRNITRVSSLSITARSWSSGYRAGLQLEMFLIAGDISSLSCEFEPGGNSRISFCQG